MADKPDFVEDYHLSGIDIADDFFASYPQS